MKKKILLISDDIRGSSGVSHIGKNLVVESINKFDWAQISAMKTHPDQGHVIDVSESISNLTKVNDCYARLYPMSGYGDELALKNVIDIESPDAILHISDPRNFEYLYDMDFDIRDNIPILYYHVWDNDPIPVFNEYIYRSCDWVGCINKKTFKFVKEISPDTQCSYIPHGVSPNIFHKLDDNQILELKTKILGSQNYDFIVFSNNVNIPRKQLPMLLNAMNVFIKNNVNKKICLLMHNNPGSVKSDNLKNIARTLYPKLDVVFSEAHLDLNNLNAMYNISDVTINIASNEGFGLSTLESLMTETPIIATDTGGLSDQMYDDNKKGDWAFPIKPHIRRLNSGGNVPFIYDDICDVFSVCEALQYWIDKSKTQRNDCGRRGRVFAENKLSLNKMVDLISENITTTINTFSSIKSKRLVKI